MRCEGKNVIVNSRIVLETKLDLEKAGNLLEKIRMMGAGAAVRHFLRIEDFRVMPVLAKWLTYYHLPVSMNCLQCLAVLFPILRRAGM